MKYYVALLCGALLLAVAGLAFGQGNACKPLEMSFTDAGVSALAYCGTDLLQDGAFQVKSAQMSHWDGITYYDADLSQGHRTVDTQTQTVSWTYPWGAASCRYIAGDNRVDMVMKVTNNAKEPLHSVVLQPLALHFPAGITLDGDRRKGNNVESPTVVGINYGKGSVVLVNDEVGPPLYVGLAAGIDDKKVGTPYPIIAGNAKNPAFPTKWMEDQVIDRTIYPGATDTFHISLRFGAADVPVEKLAADVYQNYAAAYPRTVTWSDHRPIGMLALSSVEMRSPTNPSGWLTTMKSPQGAYKNPELDIHTEQGREAFHKKLLEYADTSIAELKRVGAQGMITWDIEGQQYPHAISYLGDPRSVPAEMQPYAAEYFKRFTDAGFRVGICVRPQRPVRFVYKDDVVEQEEVADIVYNMVQKISYANKQWGCTMFYIDSNAHHDPFGSWSDEAAYQLTSAIIFEQLAKRFPDLLLIPEQKDVRYYAYAVPIRELRQGFPETPAQVRRVYPDAFDVIVVCDGKMDERHAELVDGVKHGDILMFRAWFRDTAFNDKVIQIYQEAGKGK